MPERRAKTDPKRDSDFVYRVENVLDENPTSLKEVPEAPDATKWWEAIKEELKAFSDNDVWDLVDRPVRNGKKINLLDSKWLFTKKKTEDEDEQYKARLVIRGFKDKNDHELWETPVSNMTTIRSVLAIINKYDLEAAQLDVKHF